MALLPAFWKPQSNNFNARPVIRPVARLRPGETRASSAALRYGETLKATIQSALVRWLNHRNRDGTWYAPLTIAANLWMHDGEPTFFALVIDPETLYHYPSEKLIDPRFTHALALHLGKDVYAFENNAATPDGSLPRGIVYEVVLRNLPRLGTGAPTATELPRSVKLDLSRRPSKLHVPLGVTAQKPHGLWLSIAELDAVLIGGSRRMGKTNLVHAWIAALSGGGAAHLVLFDGKGGLEFGRYRGRAGVKVVDGELLPTLRELYAEMNRRLGLLRDAGASNLNAYGKGLPRIVLIIDELAFALQESGVEALLVDLAGRGGAVGIHPVVATNQCRAEVVTANLKVNLSTRIAFAVPQASDSRVILDAPDAAHLPANIRGRLVLRWEARLIQAQAFEVDLPSGSAATAERTLSERELRIARAALERGGVFKAREIAADVGEDKNKISELARAWQARGWLTEVQRSSKGNGGRRVADALRELVRGG